MTNDPSSFDPALSPEDAAALDALLEHGRTGFPANEATERLTRVAAWLKTLDASPAPEPAGDLVERTLARVQSERMRLQPAETAAAIPAKSPRYASRFKLKHLTDFAAMTVAASLLGIVVTLGVFQARQSANRVACATNLQNVSTAFATFAADHRGNLPALAMVDANWLTPNPAIPGSHTNAENLMPLVSAKLLRPANFLCAARDISSYQTAGAGMPDAARGYSYVNMFALDHPAWDGNHANIILADRNPLFDPQAPLDPEANSANHAGHGNYAVRADGAVTWETTPNAGPAHDNIWTIGTGPQYQTRYAGTETPATEKDVFLSP